jgi:uncharacterized protein (TIGR00375 family)
MKFIADFHIHSKYSRAVSPQMTLENLNQSAQTKGVDVLGTGDFTHPEWFKSIKENLQPAEEGLFRLKSSDLKTRFLLTAEISCIYSKKGKVRKIHLVVLAPTIRIVEKINNQLNLVGNLKSDGRPILGIDAEELVKIILNVSDSCFIIPAHIWTPWFSLFGSKSGFDSLKECFGDYSRYIFALETGLSSDPPMNWRLSQLDKLTLVSNSDSHSPEKIGREANVFLGELSYSSMIDIIKSKDPKRFLYTLEFFPEEGKYHYDGHSNCQISTAPEETKGYNGLCPVCGKPLTIGVLNRISQLADRPAGFRPPGAIAYKNLVPLKEIIGEVLSLGPSSKKVSQAYDNLTNNFGSELFILLDLPLEELKNKISPGIIEGIKRVREGQVNIVPGYDGLYGKISIFSQKEKRNLSGQKQLF